MDMLKHLNEVNNVPIHAVDSELFQSYGRVIDGYGERINGFAKQLGFSDMTEMADAIAELKRDINLRCDMKDFDLTDEAVEELVSTSHHPNMLNNPVEITDEILRDMYNSYR